MIYVARCSSASDRFALAGAREAATEGALRRLSVFVLVLLQSTFALGEVTAVSEQGFVVRHVITLAGTPEAVYRALTREVSRWWDPDHSWSGDAANFSLDDRAGGCFCESLPGGGSVEHLRVVFAQPGKLCVSKGGWVLCRKWPWMEPCNTSGRRRSGQDPTRV